MKATIASRKRYFVNILSVYYYCWLQYSIFCLITSDKLATTAIASKLNNAKTDFNIIPISSPKTN